MPLTRFLLNPQVARHDKSQAFDRLALARVAVPDSARAALLSAVQGLLTGAVEHPLGEPQISPYPSALRFLGSIGLLDQAVMYDSLVQLGTSRLSEARSEAARTIAVLTKVGVRPGDMLGLVLSLSHDRQVGSERRLAER